MKPILRAPLLLILALLPFPSGAQQIESPLFAAIRGNDVAEVKRLLDAAANVSVADRAGDTPLLIAAAAGSPTVVSELLRHGADPNAGNSEGTTPLMNAAAGGQILSLSAFNRRSTGFYNSMAHQVVLLRPGGCWDGSAPLTREPTPTADRKVLQLLLAHGANIDARTEEGKTALWWAVRTGQIGAMGALLVRRANPNIPEREIGPPLLVATAMHRAEVAKILLTVHADPNLRGSDGQLPIICAAFNDDRRLVDILAAHGADLNPTLLREQKPLLSVLIEQGRAAMVKLLVAKGADPRRTDSRGENAVFAAVKRNDMSILRLLPVRGADVNRPDSSGLTPLLAAYDSAMLAALLEKGADAHARDRGGETALHKAAMRNDTAGIKLLLAHGLNADERDNFDVTPLMQAAGPGRMESLDLLLARGARVTARDKEGKTALHHAAESYGKTDAIPALLRHGADINAVNRWKQTPLIVAVNGSYQAAARILLQLGADTVPRDVYGKNARDYAVTTHQTELTSLLP